MKFQKTNKPMNKTGNADIGNLALLGMLSGGGLYGALRLVKELQRQTPTMGINEPDRSMLEITLPGNRLQKEGNVPEQGSYLGDVTKNYLGPVAAFGGGGVLSFLLASKLYDKYKDQKIRNEADSTERDYLNSLQMAQQKIGSLKTPHTDAFIEGMICKIGEEIKQAMTMPTFPEQGLFDSALHGGVMPGIKHLANSDTGKSVAALWLATALASGGALNVLYNQQAKNNKQTEEQAMHPTDIRIKTI